jgi:regulator of sigma E protease
MEIFGEISRNGFWFLVLLTPLVFVHELGHFLVARWCKVRVEVFSIGFGRELFGFTDKHGTRWKFSLLPLGGYVRMFGMAASELEGGEAPPRMMSEADRKVSFAEKKVWQRAAIVAAGPAANFIFAIVVFACLYATYGKQFTAPVLDEIVKDSAAAEAGLLPGDRILSLNGQEIATFEDLAEQILLNMDQPLQLSIDRAGQVLAIEATPRITVRKDLLGKEMKAALLGVASHTPGPVLTLGPVDALVTGAEDTYLKTVGMLKGVWQMISGQRSAEEIGGVLRIATISGTMADFGFYAFVSLAVILSINLGLINLFPVPMLDGGHLAYYAVEALRGRPLSDGAQEWGLKIGLAMVLSLMLFATWNDLVYLEVGEKFRSLFN